MMVLVRTLRGCKVDDVAVLLEHVDLLDGLDGLDVHLLQRGLQFLVIGAAGLVDFFRLAAGGAFASAVQGMISESRVGEKIVSSG